jgi:hypothetical protein
MPLQGFKLSERRRPSGSWATRVAKAATGKSTGTVRDAWVEAALDDQWMAAYRLVPGSQGQPVVAELRIFPLEGTPGRPPGQWSAEVLGMNAPVPEHGISAELIRSVRVGDYRAASAGFAKWLQGPGSKVFDAASLAKAPGFQALRHTTLSGYAPAAQKTAAKKPGRPPKHSDKFYATLARDYAQRVAAGSPKPTTDLAKRRGLPLHTVRNLLHTARERGLLSRLSQGRLGGGLTDRALALLAKK